MDLLSPLWQKAHLTMPILVLLLPLFGFVVLALFGDRMKRDGESSGAGYIASVLVIAAFLLAAWSVRALFGLGVKPGDLSFSQPALGWGAVDERIPLPWISVGGLE